MENSQEETPIIELKSFCYARAGTEILKEVSLAFREGQTTALMGGAGSGKSSLLKAAAGLVAPDSGELFYRGVRFDRLSAAEEKDFRHRSGFAFQDAALWANQSLYENLALPLRVHEPFFSKTQVERAVTRAAEIVGYEASLKVRPSELSTGERRLIGLARALVLDPEMLFMDEPAASLDEETADRVYDIVRELRARRRTLVIVSGRSDFVYRSVDSIGILKAGRLVASGSYAEIARRNDPALRSAIERMKGRGAPSDPEEDG